MTGHPIGTNAFGRETVGAAVWAFASLAAGRIVSVVALVVLARLLAPSDFGLLAFALVFVTYAETIGDLGTSAALIYWPDRDRARDDVAQLTFVVSLATGFGWLVVTLVAAPAAAAFFQNTDTTSILRVLAWTFPLKALGSTHDALAQKDLRFRARVVPELGLASLKAIVAIALASLGFGVWSLVYGHLAGVLAWTVLLWIVVPWRPSGRVPVQFLRPVLAYGRDIVSVNVLAAVVHHADVLIVGRMLGATALGFYQMAGRLPDATLLMAVRVGGKIMFPAFARLGGDAIALRSAYLSALKYASLLVVPASIALAALADPVVRVFFGPAWEPSVPMLRALALYAGLRGVGTHAGDVLKAAGRPGLLAAIGVLKVVITVPALILAARVDAAAVAAALAVVTLVTVLLNLWVSALILDARTADLVAAVSPATACGGLLAVVLTAWVMTTAALSPALVLIGGAALAVGVYVMFVRAASPEVLAMLRASFARGPVTTRPGADAAAIAGSLQ